MSPLRSAVLAGVMLVVGALLVGGRLAPSSLAATPPDRSEIVLVLDFSASILDDAANRDRFAAALDRIADRINATSADLVVGDATVSLVQFAASAADYPGCVGMRLLNSPPTVVRFADCLRSVANAYRKGLDPVLTRKIGIDTNYVAAMERAAGHLAVDAVRPALILFTDGRHDVAGVPVSQVVPARDRLFANRSPFAFLPVGMGLSPTGRDALENGLLNLRIIREMPACVSGAQFDWPQVVFETPGEAGNAVALALQNVTCTFTVEPTPTPAATPLPTPTPEPTPGAVRGITLTPGDTRIEVAWNAPATPPDPIVDYRTRCRTGGGDWMESAEGVSIKTSAAVEGLTNGVPYECEVMTVDATGEGSWIAAPIAATPITRPSPPAKPAVEAMSGGVRIQVPTEDAGIVSEYRYECSGDQGGTWPAQLHVPSTGIPVAEIGNLTNGIEYVCRAFASNSAGISDPSEASDAVRPCGSLLSCNPVLTPALGVVGFLALAGIVVALLALYLNRTRGYVVAVVDGVHSVNLGYGPRLGLGFVRNGERGPVTGIVSDRGRNAEVRIRYRGRDRFEVADRINSYMVASGEPVIAIDALGGRHSVVLRSFHTATASPVSSR
jgi:hypothetical protein